MRQTKLGGEGKPRKCSRRAPRFARARVSAIGLLCALTLADPTANPVQDFDELFTSGRLSQALEVAEANLAFDQGDPQHRADALAERHLDFARTLFGLRSLPNVLTTDRRSFSDTVND